MTPLDFYKHLSTGVPGIQLPPLLPLKFHEGDVMAAKLLLWLYEQLPEDSTQGDLDNILDAAKWWSTFFAAAAAAAEDIEKREDDTLA